MLFYGPPGTGKTSVALVVANRLFGTEFRSRVLELNASDDRGIDVVRHRIKERASHRVAADGDAPDFQLIILDEADCMTTVCVIQMSEMTLMSSFRTPKRRFSEQWRCSPITPDSSLSATTSVE